MAKKNIAGHGSKFLKTPRNTAYGKRKGTKMPKTKKGD